jgi:valyl-tRNA synthetase
MDTQYDPRGLEEKWYARWEADGLFAPRESPEPPFVIVLPPPNVTGILHIGHCLGASIMDSLVRYHRMCGRPALFVPGTDHASIATENRVVGHLASQGIDRNRIGREKFLEHAWEWARQHHDRIVSQFKRFGVSLDWSREAFTMDDARYRAVIEAFVRLYRKGLIYRGDYMVNWSVAQQSAVSDEEVVHREVHGKLWHFRYPLRDGGHLVVATTRPETMLGDTAVAIHPAHAKTAPLRGKTVVLPLVGREIPVIEDEHVDPEFGTGCVKVTPAHDPNDYEIAQRHDLAFVNILNPDGTLNDNVPSAYRGLDRFEARKRVVHDLGELGLIEGVEDHTHMVGYHDRTNTVIEPYISRQWFLRMDDLAKPAITAVEKGTIAMIPERWVGVYFNWMRNIKDWCISRQLWWGHRIPYYECPSCGHAEVAAERPPRCGDCGADDLRQDDDVLDTWFSSWLWTFSPLGWPDRTSDLERFHPTTVMVTAADIIFFWVARMIMASYEFLGEPPFTEVVYTGLVRDGEGRKLSKSLNNSPDPMDIMDRFGADALRFVLVMLTPTGQDINFGDDTVEVGRNFCNKMWNATRLLFTHLDDSGLRFPAADPSAMVSDMAADGVREGDESDAALAFAELYRRAIGADLPEGDLGPLALEDRWMIHRVATAAQGLEAAFAARRLNDAAYAGYDCFWHEYCDWYLEAIKPRLRGEDAAARRTALLVALMVHGILLRLLHPFLPYITEELWSIHPATSGFCMVAPMPRFGDRAPFGAAAERFELARNLVTAARNLRSELGVPPGRRGDLILRGSPGRVVELEEIAARVEALAKMESVRVEPTSQTKPPQAVAAVVGDVEVFLPVAGLVDLEKEKARLAKERDAVARRLAGVQAKLGNANFVERAPSEVVERERELAVSLEETLAKIDGQVATLELPE